MPGRPEPDRSAATPTPDWRSPPRAEPRRRKPVAPRRRSSVRRHGLARSRRSDRRPHPGDGSSPRPNEDGDSSRRIRARPSHPTRCIHLDPCRSRTPGAGEGRPEPGGIRFQRLDLASLVGREVEPLGSQQGQTPDVLPSSRTGIRTMTSAPGAASATSIASARPYAANRRIPSRCMVEAIRVAPRP